MAGDVQLEEVERALFLSLRQHLSTELAGVASEMVAKDSAFFTALGQTIPVTPLAEPVQWFMGHHPSILDRPLEEYPNCTVMCYEHRLAPDANSIDQIEYFTYLAYAEIFVWNEDESAVNRIAKRYAKALHRAVLADPSLGGLVEPVVRLPESMVSNVSARRVSDVTDDYVYFQGCRLEYPFRIPELI